MKGCIKSICFPPFPPPPLQEVLISDQAFHLTQVNVLPHMFINYLFQFEMLFWNFHCCFGKTFFQYENV